MSDREYWDHDPGKGCGIMLLLLLIAFLVILGVVAFIIWQVVT